MIPWLLVLAAYLWGAIPASYLAGKWTRGIDLRRHGSGNLGATNTFRVLGARVAAPVMVFDILKGLLPVVIFSQLDGSADWRWELAYGAAAVVGHVFSVYMKLRGGKGVATSAGVFLALAPIAVGVGLAVWLVVMRLTRMVSAGSVAAALAVAVILHVPGAPVRPPVRILGTGVALFVVFAHRSNLARILRGEESRFSFGRRPRSATEETVAAAAVAADAEEEEEG
ncbi:MAG TPA: glycerol-3-phosphate 1-O-acyltransferase PlsY [Longimicrobiaceae bacterium]|nr:glycerol-3-phosphate 1-O-acyltransferase PlsY [Longimicrobiaceae bacterium]